MLAAKVTSKGQITIPKQVRDKLGIEPDEVIISSTGVIGQQMPMQNLLSGSWAVRFPGTG